MFTFNVKGTPYQTCVLISVLWTNTQVSGGTKKIELKTIDSSMQKIGQDGQVLSRLCITNWYKEIDFQKKKITSRCAEIDLEVCAYV